MSKKVTGSDFKKLLEGVLNEKIKNQLVSPEVDLYTKRGKDSPPRGSAEDNKENWKELGVKRKIKDKSLYFDKLAATSPAKKTLSVDDLRGAVADMISRLQTGVVPNKDQKDRDSAIAIMKKSASSELQSIIKDVYQDYFKNNDQDSEELDLSAITGEINSYLDKLADDEVTPFAGQELPFKSLETSVDNFSKAFKPQTNPSLVNLFGGVDGNSIKEKLKSIEDFSKNAESDTLEQWASGKDQFAPFIYSKVLSYLANEIKTRGAKEAGYSFEKWLAVLLNFPVVGADNGAADNLGKVGATTIYTSAKLYANLSGEYGPSQSTNGMKEITSKGDKIYYFIAIKTKDPDAKSGAEGFSFIATLDLYLVEISEDNGQLKGRFIYDDAKATSKEYILPEDPKKSTQSKLTPLGFEDSVFEQYKFSTIYLPQGEVTDASLTTTAQFLASQVNKIKDQPATKAIMDAATTIKKVEANTDSYVGKSKQKKGSASDYIKKITDDMDALDNLYKQIFQYGEDTNSETPITESKKVTPSFLKKLIQEKFKK
jgi:hypothetical protein